MKNRLSQKSVTGWVAGLIVVCLILDQAIKIYIKLNFRLGEIHSIFPWFALCFVENDGMAFGIEWFDKMFLTLFRIGLVGVLCWYLHSLIRKQARIGYILMVTLVVVGALGNIIDCLFYGIFFSASTPYEVATFLPEQGGYAGLFYGKVVDMLYFPLIHNAAGETIFFRPVFNFADSCITVAVIVIFIFYGKDLNLSLSNDKNEDKHKDK
ncbi:MAG: lipoprotein signal peptidase [Paludibacter sp.]|nr:lipoprotein signal peptidase [Bacteroidales bacterium]MCM1069601.1 lipoprotein signal peptidase [Prevotella sp.]MCM1354247.1 lipoprotein signal peptidase [Bacteroides sp.]MCM1443086.1 lipoprotein signal peptidase [Muribaculum sp.]MCM1482321.1 lipoprotein signal peptidase [Paludibacter sp.]